MRKVQEAIATPQEVVALLEPDDARCTSVSTLAMLRNMAAQPRFRDALREAGAIPPLVTLVRAAFIEIKTASGPAGILASLALAHGASSAFSPQSPAPSPSPPQSPANAAFQLAHLVHAALQQEDSTRSSDADTTTASDVAAGTLTCLARAARFKEHVDSPQTAAEAAGALTSLAHSQGEGASELLQAAAEATAALANLAAANTANQDAIRKAGAIGPLVAVLRSEAAPVELLREAAGALNNLCIGNIANQEHCQKAGAIVSLVSLVGGSYSTELAQRAAAALRNMGDENAVRTALVRLLRHQHQQRRLPPASRKPLQPLAAVYNGKRIAKHRRSAAAAAGAPNAD